MMRSVQRILAILESFTAEDNCLSLHEIAGRIALPKSTTFRLVQSLEESGYLIRLEDQRYCLSFRITRLAGMVRSTLGIREIARPLMRTLAERTGETVSLYAADEGMRVCIDAVATALPLRSVSQPGERVSLARGSSSKVLVAFARDPKPLSPIRAEMAKLGKMTEAQVRAELEQIRQQGYAVSHGERVLGVAAVSAPIRGLDDEGHYCLSVAGPLVRMQSREREFTRLVVQAASEISWLYGGNAPP
ncbi:MAG: IclR family transcriptional regulator [Ramlibacter sp.]|uniref:IclR family transcriptional regulator n=1 Tax=Ramlibacter sp. TaxID=1917967 RepID=UPI00262FD184|nr:IclR family transcriptional regulator [Ramlibacter sp.]MDH4375792.1 IclR family transcriptional regulator [Ramlibacter sp.]